MRDPIDDALDKMISVSLRLLAAVFICGVIVVIYKCVTNR